MINYLLHLKRRETTSILPCSLLERDSLSSRSRHLRKTKYKMGTSQSRPPTTHHPYFTTNWGSPPHLTAQYGHHRPIRPAFGFGGPPSHLRKR